MKVLTTVITILGCGPWSMACSSSVGSNSLSAASEASLSSSSIYASIQQLAKTPDGLAAIKSTGAQSITSAYAQLLAASTDAAASIDGISLSGVHSALVGERDAVMTLNTKFPSMQQQWAAAGIDPLHATEADYRQAFAATASQFESLGKRTSASLGLADDDPPEDAYSQGALTCANWSNLGYALSSLATAGCILAEWVPEGGRLMRAFTHGPCLAYASASLVTMGVNGLCQDIHDGYQETKTAEKKVPPANDADATTEASQTSPTPSGLVVTSNPSATE